MNLFTVLLNIHEHCNADTLYVEQPWTLESKVILRAKDDSQSIFHDSKVFEYFLEIFIIKELFEDNEAQNVCLQDQCLKIIEYAINDA